jgi:hypothetical protein
LECALEHTPEDHHWSRSDQLSHRQLSHVVHSHSFVIPRVFAGFGRGATFGLGVHLLVRIIGLSRSYPVRLSLAVREFESMTICCADRNGIPRIRDTGSPKLTLVRKVVDFQLPFPDDNSIFTYSLHDSGDSDSDERLSSSGGRGYRRNSSLSTRSELITVEGQPMSSSARTGNGNSEILGPKASNVATRWGTVRESTYESVSSSRVSRIAAATGRRKDEAPVLVWLLGPFRG